jgi:hypothetical protein
VTIALHYSPTLKGIIVLAYTHNKTKVSKALKILLHIVKQNFVAFFVLGETAASFSRKLARTFQMPDNT